MTRLRRSDQEEPGFSRRAHGRGSVYLDRRGNRISDAAVVERCKKLGIPPAWRDVWICADERGHLQATGLDDAGRRQYLYHPDWRTRQDERKFLRVVGLSEAFPEARRIIRRDLRRPDLDRTRVLAASLRLLDRGLLRVGSEAYLRSNGSVGLTTLSCDHARTSGGRTSLAFVAKAGQAWDIEVKDPLLTETVAALKARRSGSERLFAFEDPERGWVDLRAEDVNEQVRLLVGPDATAKDFRTWNANVLAAALLARAATPVVPETATARRKAVKSVVDEVAAALGNTPAVCRRSYVDQRIIDAFDEGRTIPNHLGGGVLDLSDRRRAQVEASVRKLISAEVASMAA